MRSRKIEIPSSIATYDQAVQHIATKYKAEITRENLGEIEVLEELIRAIQAKNPTHQLGSTVNTIARALDAFAPSTIQESEKKTQALAFLKGIQFATRLPKKAAPNR